MTQPIAPAGALSHADLFHTAIVVDDIEAAKAEFGALLGLTWHEGGGKVTMQTAQGQSRVATQYAISVEGPHHVELVQSTPGTLYTTNGSTRAHHVGYWVDDVPTASEALVSSGLTNVVLISFGGDRPPITAYHEAGDGFWIELVARSMKPLLFPEPAAR
ncbi:MAG TPA: VOC family protein [Frankiaceae bacterium]|jgi:catechol 2,3-dioxygenase-like lactoylglutathione lyase family enzyme|nr:VOC family protein [Frankiaceae bacterium]